MGTLLKAPFMQFILLVMLVFGFVAWLYDEEPVVYNEADYIKTLNDGRMVMSSSIGIGDATDYLFYMQEDRDYHILINCFGGSAFDTVAIMNRISNLKRKGYKITTEVHGFAFSGGFCVFIMGDRRIIHSGAALMVHGGGFGAGTRHSLRNDDDLKPEDRRALEIMDAKIFKEIWDATPLFTYQINQLLYKEDSNYLSSKEAMELGLATELKGGN